MITGGEGQGPQRPGETFLRDDVKLSVEYRKEYYKYVLTISTALLAFTISFQPTLRVSPQYIWSEIVGWVGLGVAVACGVRIHMVWSTFFSATQKYLNKGLVEDARKVRTNCNKERRFLEVVLLVAFVMGVAGVIGFTAANLKNVALKTDDTSAAQKDPAHRAADTQNVPQEPVPARDHAANLKSPGL